MDALATTIEQGYDTYLPPSGVDLTLGAFMARQGLSEHHDMIMLEGSMSMADLVGGFPVEQNSDVIPEYDKMQRDVSSGDVRTRRLDRYLNDRTDWLLPQLVIFVTQGQLSRAVKIGPNLAHSVTLPADAERVICDGQGRRVTVAGVLAERAAFGAFTIPFKLIITKTARIRDAKRVICQAFADLNGEVTKPNASINGHFNTSRPMDRLMDELLETEIADGKCLQDITALNGLIKPGQLWTYKQVKDMVLKSKGTTEGKANAFLRDDERYADFLENCRVFIRQVFKVLPLGQLSAQEEHKAAIKEALWTKSLFALALAWVARSLTEDALFSGKLEWAKLEGLAKLPLHTLDDPMWIEAGISLVRDGRGDRRVTINKGTDDAIARLLCRHLRIQPSQGLF
ncbi:DGQHR domain-containing protein [Ferrimonas marina]|uniref:DGQHR domain-containing protein n=1 Tax=Ferrimonas marina TaxID=299255 RepID=A0A1M5TWR6_9GAMM|nr:DGQHR domain-containing protein [Ferrimonas marina]SHH55265.1 DGQHR domain-containing protein [Ferrimonas marina]